MKYKYNFNKGDKVSDYYSYLSEDNKKSTSNHRYIFVKCSCGTKCSVRLDIALQSNRSCKKCGQLKRRNTFSEKTLTSLFKRLYHSYIAQAKKRNYSFDLEFDTFCNYTKQNCFYCNEPASNTLKQNYRSITYNGLDRIDNTKGYVEGNIVSCCGQCNMMKNKFSKSEFLTKIKQIAYNLNLYGDAFTPLDELREETRGYMGAICTYS